MKEKNKRGIIYIFFLSFVLFFPACQGEKSSGAGLAGRKVSGEEIAQNSEISPRDAAVGMLAPDFRLRDLNGDSRSLADYPDKVILLDFWASWCPPCRMSIPFLIKLFSRHQTQGLLIIGINLDQNSGEGEKFARQAGINYPVLLGGKSNVGEIYRVSGIPTFYLLGRDGKIRQRWVGFSPDTEEKIEEEINLTLGLLPIGGEKAR